MGISNYGLWKGTPTSWNGKADTDHGHLTFTDSTDSSKSHEADVNIMSSGKETRLVYWLVSSYNAQKPSTSQLQALSQGFSKQSGSDSLALDLLREDLVDVDTGVLLSHDAKDPDEKGDILSYLDPIMDEAVSSKATIYIWGSQYKDSDGSSGIHDIHMNQGSAGSFEKENGTYQDGGIVIEFGGDRWEGVFLAFASQATKTDSKGDPDGPTFASTLSDSSSSGAAGSPSTGGGTTDTTTTPPATATKGVSIEAALVNPTGPDDAPTSGGQGETVYVMNRSSKAQSLEGWTVGNDKGESQALSGSISANVKKEVAVKGFRLSNKGGKIVLKDGKGETVSEVSYTEKQARKEGKLLYFAN
ncbi:hypothetical protein VMCG_10189 [Cytospora schulzeri]|uniref:LTD domain-containing protein n=1 Tax=Cytospora schulzeri TaxID=448051 RepID=A0A423VD01_9PEZI|nr:hypothetical protein VMCG_10189 [Valsa malicola]